MCSLICGNFQLLGDLELILTRAFNYTWGGSGNGQLRQCGAWERGGRKRCHAMVLQLLALTLELHLA